MKTAATYAHNGPNDRLLAKCPPNAYAEGAGNPRTTEVSGASRVRSSTELAEVRCQLRRRVSALPQPPDKTKPNSFSPTNHSDAQRPDHERIEKNRHVAP